MKDSWNLWHGCRKLSEGCANCYVYRIDGAHGRDPAAPHRTGAFGLPLRKNRAGEYRISPGSTLWTCFTSDFFLEEADEWRREAWQIIAARPDVTFIIITKRIARFRESLPDDWGDGYPNVRIGCTCENQRRADERLPSFSPPRLHIGSSSVSPCSSRSISRPTSIPASKKCRSAANRATAHGSATTPGSNRSAPPA